MPKTLNKILIKKATQISDSHCGPAVIQMLLGHVGIETTQEEITKEAGATETIKTMGTRIDQLAQAVYKIAPKTTLWHKRKATIEDIFFILRKYNYPIGVEWQGIFESDEEDGDDDPGHYSVIIDIDDEKKKIFMADPYKDYFSGDRIISIRRFLNRWWDVNEIIDQKTGRKKRFKDERLIFLVIPKMFNFPKEIGMKSNLEIYPI